MECNNIRKSQGQYILETAEQSLGKEAPIELIRIADDTWQGALITPSAKKPSQWQVTFFEGRGILGDHQLSTKLAALEDAIASGYSTIAQGLLASALRSNNFSVE